MRAARIGWTAFACIGLGSGCAPAEDPWGELEMGVTEALAHHRKATLHDLRYTLELTVPASESEALTGSVTMAFTRDDPADAPVVVDFLEPEQRVRAVRVDGVDVPWSPAFDHIVIPAASFEDGSAHDVSIDFVAGDEALNRNPEFLYTLFVPDRAHFSLPVLDQPDLKAPYTVTLHMPEAWVAVANGGVASETVEDGIRTVRFRETQPIPTYLLAFAVGDFRVEEAERDGRTYRMYHRETDDAKVARNAPEVFDLHHAALEWLEEYTNIPYPYGKFDFVLIPPFQYGGMEHPGAIFYRQSSLFLDESATQGRIVGRASLIAHETAHMWFGDLVTMAWFDDVWTKEVFANFMAAKIVHPSFPELDHDLRFFLAHHNTAYGVDRTPGANPVRQPLDNLREAGTLYGAIIYQKAPIMMKQLELLLGEERFREGMRRYLSRFAHGNATWPDLIEILDGLTEEDLRSWSRVWVEEPGRAEVSASWDAADDGTLASLTLRQTDPAGSGRIWPQAVEVLLGSVDGSERLRVRMSGSTTEVEAARDRPLPEWILLNGSGFEYGYFRLDPVSRDALLASLPDVRDARTRGIAWVTLWDAVLMGDVPVEAWYALLLRGVAEEAEEQNAQRVLGFLRQTFWNLLSDSEREARASELETALWSRIGSAPTTTFRAAVFNTWRGVVTTPEGVDRLRAFWAGDVPAPVPLSENDRTETAAALAIRGVSDAPAILDAQAGAITNPDRRARFDFVRDALSEDPSVREAFFERLRDPAERAREPWVLSGLGYLHHPLRREHARQFVVPALEMVEEIQRTGDIFFPKRWLDASLGSHNDPELNRIVRAWIDGLDPSYPHRLRGKILQSADALDRASALVGGVDP